MNASQPTQTAYFNYIGSIELPTHVVSMCHHTGDCENDCIQAMLLPEVKAELSEIDAEQLRKELREYGAWDDDELQDHQQNLIRILWIAAGDIQDGK